MNTSPVKDYAQADDSHLVVWAKDDLEAFGELYQRYVKKIYNYVYYRTHNHHDAEDLTARVFFRAMSHIGSYVDQGVPFSAWLYRIAHNLVANWHRDRGRRRMIALEDHVASESPGQAPEHLAESGEETAALLTAIEALPEERQQLIIMKYVDRLSNAEIGRIMNRTEGAVKSLYHRTLQALRKNIQRTKDNTVHPES